MTGKRAKAGIACWAILSAMAISPVHAQGAAGFISKWDGGPVFAGEGWEFKINGRLLVDYSIIDADRADTDWRSSEIRNLRLAVAGKFGGNLNYKIEFNTDSSGDVVLEDGFFQWAPTSGDWDIKLGHYKPANSLDELNSARFISLFERAAFTDAFEFNRRLGISLNADGARYTLSAGLFGDNLYVDGPKEGYVIAGRATFNPVKTDDTLLHLAASVRYRGLGDGQGDLRYRQRPYSRATGRLLSTGSIARSDVFLGAEAAGLFGRHWVAGEYGVTKANCSAAATASGACIDDPTFQGGYGEIGTILGGKRTYKGGKFDRPKVDNPITKGGMGALLLVARFDTIDLNDSGINGGSQNTMLLGADWYATKYTHIGINLFKTDARLGTSTSGLDAAFADLVRAGVGSEDVSGALIRAQFDF